MPAMRMTDADIARAQQIWAEYQQKHDLSHRQGQAAGIDPVNGRIWFGESAIDIAQQRTAEGLDSPLFFVRVGFPTYCRKGGRR